MQVLLGHKAIMPGLAATHILSMRIRYAYHFILQGMKDTRQLRIYARDIRADIQSALTKAGIRDVPQSEKVSTFDVILYIDAGGIYHALVRFLQKARLERDPKIAIFIATWSVEGTGSFQTERVRGMRQSVQHSMDRFITDWTVANAPLPKAMPPLSPSARRGREP